MEIIESGSFDGTWAKFKVRGGMELKAHVWRGDSHHYWEADGTFDKLLDFPILAGLRAVGHFIETEIPLTNERQTQNEASSIFIKGRDDEPSLNFSVNRDGNPMVELSVQSHPRITFKKFYSDAAKVLESIDAKLVKTKYYDSPQEQLHELTTTWSTGDRTVWQLLNCAHLIEMIGWPGNATAEHVTAQHATRLIVNGNINSLLGLREDGQLEAKSALYEIDTNAGKFELAKDVAQFANSPSGGILIIGMRTKGDGTGDVFAKITPLEIQPKTDLRYKSVLESRIYPAIEGLGIGLAPHDGGHVMYITIPPQKDSLKPFIVQGAAIGETVRDSFFLIPQRRGDSISSIPGKALHAFLAGKLFGANEKRVFGESERE